MTTNEYKPGDIIYRCHRPYNGRIRTSLARSLRSCSESVSTKNSDVGRSFGAHGAAAHDSERIAPILARTARVARDAADNAPSVWPGATVEVSVDAQCKRASRTGS